MRSGFTLSAAFLCLLASALTARAQESDDVPNLELKPIATVIVGEEDLAFVLLSRDGKTLATAGAAAGNTVDLWNAASGKSLGTLKGTKDTVVCAAFAADGKTLIVGDDGGMIGVWDVAGRKLRKSFSAAQGIVFCTGISNDGKLTFAGMLETAPALFNTATRKRIGAERNQKGMTTAFASADKSRMIVSGNDSGVVQFFDEKTGKERRSIQVCDNEILALRFSPDEKTLAVGTFGDLWLADIESGKPTLVGEVGSTRVAFTADGKSLVVANPPSIMVWDLKTRKRVGQTRVERLGGRDRASLSADGTIAAMVISNKEVQVLEIPSGKAK